MNAREILNMSEQDGVPLLTALLRRDWAVRVLDAWAAAEGVRKRVEYPIDNEGDAFIFLKDETADGRLSSRHWQGPLPDAARLAAAEAVWPELPESVRAELGERP